MIVNARYYGMISEKFGRTSEEIVFESSKLEINLSEYFENKYPVLKDMSYKIAVDQEFTNILPTDGNNHEIAILPPFAGG